MSTRILLIAALSVAIKSTFVDPKCNAPDVNDLKRLFCGVSEAEWTSSDVRVVQERAALFRLASDAAVEICENLQPAKDEDIKVTLDIIGVYQKSLGERGVSASPLSSGTHQSQFETLSLYTSFTKLAKVCFTKALEYIKGRCRAALVGNAELASDITELDSWWESHSKPQFLPVEDTTISENAGKIAGILDACPKESSAATADFRAESDLTFPASEAERRPELSAVALTPSEADGATADKPDLLAEATRPGDPAAPKVEATVDSPDEKLATCEKLTASLKAVNDRIDAGEDVAAVTADLAAEVNDLLPSEKQVPADLDKVASLKTIKSITEGVMRFCAEPPRSEHDSGARVDAPVKSAAPKSNDLLVPAALGGIAAVMLSGSSKRSSIAGTLARVAAGAGVGAVAHHWWFGRSRKLVDQ